jgi:phosphatidylserine decarboxylase
VVVRQVVGILARRIVCRIQEGQTLQRGERIGLMKFGSRMDVFLPPRAEIVVEAGQQVVAGETVLARLHPRMLKAGD